jgi:nucleotide-binding universal stress UspA family protein
MSIVIVGFDAREEADDALMLGHALASVYGAELHVAVVLPRARLPIEEAIAGGQVSSQLDERLYKSAERRLRGTKFIRASLDGGLGGRSAARALYEYAEDQEADLIVVGSSHRGKLGRLLPGSVGESLLRGAPCAVAIAPRGFARREQTGFRRIGVAYDGFEEADLALEEAKRLSSSLGAELRVITVVPILADFDLSPDVTQHLLADHRQFYREKLELASSKLGAHPRVQAALEEGDPAAVLVEQGGELDLLVMGARGYGPVRSALLGATSSAVIRTAPCPVLITPSGTADKSEPNKQWRANREFALDQ